MKLSIITINYNNYQGLCKTIKSVITQTTKEFEWIIIDGGSNDGSFELINKTADNCPQITYWCSELDKGIYNAMNKGIRKASGEYLLFLNSGDCLLDNEVVGKVLPMLNGQDIYVGDLINCYGDRQEIVKFPRNLTPIILLEQLVFKFIPHQASFIRNALFERFGYYREDLKIASDWHFFFKAIVNGATVQSISLTIALFDMEGISNTNSKRIAEREISLNEMPCMKELFTYYRDNAEITKALNATIVGRLLKRIYFFFFRKIF